MSRVETQEEADRLNKEEATDTYVAANGHLMRAPLIFPRDDEGQERFYEIGDEIRYTSWNAWCDERCDHREIGPLEDW